MKRLAFNTNLNVLAISETHLSPALKDHEIAIQGYQILRRDRIGAVLLSTIKILWIAPRLKNMTTPTLKRRG